MASLDDVVTFFKSAVNYLGLINQTLNNAFPQVQTVTVGSFTCSAASSTVVQAPLVAANSQIILMPTNAAAATLMAGSNSLYVSARTANVSFTASTAAGGSAAGTETFQYLLMTV